MPLPWLIALLFAGGAGYLWWKQQTAATTAAPSSGAAAAAPPASTTPSTPGSFGLHLNNMPGQGQPPAPSGPPPLMMGAPGMAYFNQGLFQLMSGNQPDPNIAAGAQSALNAIPTSKQFPVITSILQALIATPTQNQLQAAINQLNATPSNQGPSAVSEAQAVASQLSVLLANAQLGGSNASLQPPGSSGGKSLGFP